MGVVNTNHRAMIDKHCRIRFLCLKTSLCFVFSQLLQACYLHTLLHDEFWSTCLHCGTQQRVSVLRGSDGGEVEGDSVSTMVGGLSIHVCQTDKLSGLQPNFKDADAVYASAQAAIRMWVCLNYVS